MSAVPAHVHQGSDAWHEWRRTRGGASEVGALMGCAPWFPRTPLELWQVKTGRAVIEVHAAMTRGTALEPAARTYAEELFGETFEPQTAELGRIVASLDGITFDGDCVLEIKVPAKGRDSETWQHVATHKAPPAHYWWQAQQQLLCSGAGIARFVVCHAEGEEITDAIYCDVLPDAQAHEAIKVAWAQFFAHLDADTPPAMTDKDVIERSDRDWRDAVAEWKAAKANLEAAKAAEDEARKALLALAGEQSTAGAGVKATRYFVAGNTDYKRAAEDAGADLSNYQKPGRWQWRLSESE